MSHSVDRLAKLVGGTLLRATGACPQRAIHDSRLVEPGDLFIALPGTRTDGHRHLAEAFARGACAALVSDARVLPEEAHDVVVVPDCVSALHTWAADHRRRLNGRCIGITGTNGKTTVKRMLFHFLAGHARTYAAPHNYNTEIGLPLALLSMPIDTQIGLFELGTERPGDIGTLAQILSPSWAVLTSVGPGHLDGLGSVENVAVEKWSLVESLPPSATAIVSAESPHLLQRASSSCCRTLTVGFSRGDIQARLQQTTPVQLEMEDPHVTLSAPLLGEHNALNLLLAAVTAHQLGVTWASITRRAATLSAEPHRLQMLAAPFGTVLDDTYNANPASMAAALRVLVDVLPDARTRVFVFGEMHGLGPATATYHDEILEHALSLPVDWIIPVGTEATAACRRIRSPRIYLVSCQQVPAHLRTLGPDAVVLIKGSRGMELDKMVSATL